MGNNLLLLAFILIVSIVSGLIQTVTGFGAGIVLLLFLSYVFSVTESSAITQAVCIALSLTLSLKYKDKINLSLVFLPATAYIAMSYVAIRNVQAINIKVLTASFGGFLILLSLFLAFLSKRVRIKSDYKAAIICGGISGLCAGLFGIGGPLMALYYYSTLDDRIVYISSIQFFFFLTGAFNLLARAFHHFYTIQMVPLIFVGIIGILIGKYYGINVSGRLNAEKLKKTIYSFVGVSGVITIFKALID